MNDSDITAAMGKLYPSPAAQPHSVLPPRGHRIAPPGAPGSKAQWAEAMKLPPDQRPGSFARASEIATLGGSNDIKAGVNQMRQPGISNKVGGAATIAQGLGKSIALPAAALTMGTLGIPEGLTALGTSLIGGTAGSEAASGLASLVTDDPNYQKAAGVLGGIGGAWYTGRLASAVSDAFGARNARTEAANTPQAQAHRVFAPGKNDTGFDEDMVRAIPRVKQAEAILQRPIGGHAEPEATAIDNTDLAPGAVARDTVNAAKLAKQAAYSRFQWAAGPYLDSSQPTDIVASEIEKLITPAMRSDPSIAAQQKIADIQSLANQYRGSSMTVRDAADNAASKNAELRAFYKTSDDAMRAQMAAIKDPMLTQAEANGYRRMIYKPFEDAITNARTPEEAATARQRLSDAEEARRDYGAIDSFQEHTEGKINPASRQEPPSLLGSLLTAGKAAIQAKSGNIGAAHGTVASMSPSDIDAALRDLFKSVPDQPSDVRNANLTEVAPVGAKRLGPATSPVGVSGVIVPDLTGMAQRDAAAMNTGPRQLPAASGGPIITPELSGVAKEAARRLNKGPAQLTPATQPTMGGSGTVVPGNTSLSPRGVYGQSQLPPPSPGQPPLNLPQQPPADIVTGPGAGGAGVTQSTGTPPAPLPAPGEIGGDMSDVVKQRRAQAAESRARSMGRAIVAPQGAAPDVSSGTLKWDPTTQAWIPK